MCICSLFLQTGLPNDSFQAVEVLQKQVNGDDISHLFESSRHVNLPCTPASDADNQTTQSSAINTNTATKDTISINQNTDLSPDNVVLIANKVDNTAEAGLGDSVFTSSLDVVSIETAQSSEVFTVDGTPHSEALDKAFIATDQSLSDTVESTTNDNDRPDAVQSPANDNDRLWDIHSTDGCDAGEPLCTVDSSVEPGPDSSKYHSFEVTPSRMTIDAAAADDDDVAVPCACDTLGSLITLLKSTINSARSGIV